MVIVYVPSVAFLPTFTVIFVVPDADSDVGLKVTLLPLPCPDPENVIAVPSVPLTVAVIVELALPFLPALIDVGDAGSVNVAPAAVTVRLTVVVSIMLPDVPVTVIG